MRSPHIITSALTRLARRIAAASAAVAALMATEAPAAAPSSAASRPNVLFISIDDLNDWVGVLGGRADVKTPHIDRLARRGLLFTNAHCPAPQCGPSRATVMLGRNPSTTGIYDNSQWWRPLLPDVVTLPAHFKRNGYWTEGAGKNFHHTPGFNDPPAWSHYFHWSPGAVERGWDGGYQRPPDPRPAQHPAWPEFQPLSAGEFDVAPLDVPDEAMPDHMVATHAADFLRRHAGSQPFFLGVGIFRPHQAWYVPRKYFDLYPLESIALPPFKADDRDDLPAGAQVTVHGRTNMHGRLVQAGKWKPAVQAYLAAISFADAQVGVLLDALDRSAHARNTLVVLWSDHGFHLGEKGHWQKWSLWQRGTHVPLIVAGPGVAAGSRSSRPVGLVDLYPTLIELCGLPPVERLDGRSLVPLLRNPAAAWPHYALTTLERGNHSLMGERWHYIRYADGSEELYDLENDPHEWTNLAGQRELEPIKAEFRARLPRHDAEPAPRKNAYDFDPAAYTWRRRARPE